ncbi:MAG: chitobiase/beta-hexosaminidase C-terminal domain-containing protein, partial [Verrucomicrobiales bacterium]|nr:chitobiase/beta-hexosaminidase C-terminal domain-containing protein [Verrucomicrobiales bacterium]
MKERGIDTRDRRSKLGLGLRWALVWGWVLWAWAAGASAADNLALGRPVTAPGPLWEGLGPETITDGDPATFTHPRTAQNEGFFFQVDLGASYPMQRILVRHRADGCCPGRLARYRVELYEEGGDGDEVGILNWVAVIRDGTTEPASGEVDTITPASARFGVFGGRFVRVIGEGDSEYNPQVAEIEVYGGAPPRIRALVADTDHVARGGSTVLRWEVEGAQGGELRPGIGVVSLPTGSITVSPSATTVYSLVVSNGQGTATAEVRVGVEVTLEPPVLSELGAVSEGGLRDEDGEESDWVELLNPNEYSLDLSVYALSDDPAVPLKWPMPAARLAAGARRLVYASGKDRRPEVGEWHTNFRLDAAGDRLGLAEVGTGRVVGRIPLEAGAKFPRQVKGVGYGWGTNGVMGYLRPATPGARNGMAVDGLVEPVEVSVVRGFRDTEASVTLGTATLGAVIRYTLDRTEPTRERGSVYAGPITVAQTTVLRAAAFRDGWEPSPVVTHTYVFPSQVVSSSVMRRSITTNALYAPQLRDALLDLPSLSLVSGSAIGDTSETRSSLEWIDPKGGAGFQVGCGARRFGGAYTDFAKKSFRLYFKSEYGVGRLRFPVFGSQGEDSGLPPAEEYDQLELRSGSHDMEMRGFYLSNPFTDDTMMEMGQLSPHGRFVHLYLNGTYWGVYHLRERWGGAMHASYRGGEKTEYESINGNWNVGGWAEPGTAYDGNGAVWARVKSLRSDYASVRSWLDVANYIDFMLVWLFGGCEDEYRCVGAVAPGNGFQFLINDADGWFCVPNYCAAGNRTGGSAPGRESGDGPGSLFSMLFKAGDPDYRALLADRIHRALGPGGALSPERNAARLERRVRELERPFLVESARWGYLSPSAWAQRRDSVANSWLPQRSAAFLAELRGAGLQPRLATPTLLPAGGLVSAGTAVRFSTTSGATVYYTVDGSDPRLPGGGVSPTAREFRVGGRVETPVPAGLRWRWHTSAAGLSASDVVEGSEGWSASDWKHPDFEDGSWAEGPAQLGYGDGDEATVLPFGGVASAKWITSYFRRRFDVTDPAGVTTLRVRVRRDDGVIVYLNGRECVRSGMGAGRVGSATLAEAATDDGQEWLEFGIDGTGLRSVGNVLTAELHQASASSTDISFDLELELERGGGAQGQELRMEGNTVVRSRAWQAGIWSGMGTSYFETRALATPDRGVVLSEVHFDPAGLDGAEFLELQNRSSEAVDLRGARFVEGVQFRFPSDREVILAPGARLVLVRDLLRFRARYGMDVPVFGKYAGQLANDGETVALADGGGGEFFRVRYGVRGPWPQDAADAGPSMEFVGGAGAGASEGARWLPSAVTGGSPGGDGAVVSMSDADAARDGDGDGLPALVEALLLTRDDDPVSGSDVLEYHVEGRGRLVLSVRRGLKLSGVRLRMEASADLRTWVELPRESIRVMEEG